MKQLFIVANWKAHSLETEKWFQGLSNSRYPIPDEKKVIVCPPFHLLASLSQAITDSQLPIDVGSQDISAFPAGAYTGEEPAEILKKFVTYAIIGHSERRNYLHETNEILEQKVSMARQHGIEPIFCVQDEHTPVPEGVSLVAYEPLAAIGSGHPDTPENANAVAQSIAQSIAQANSQVSHVLYGGSVTPDNVHSFTNQPAIAGVLVGGASLDPEKFATILANA